MTGMTAISLVSLNDRKSLDPFADDVVALLHMDGSDGSTTFTDATGRAWTRSGTSVAVDTDRVKYGTGAALANGGAYISTPASADFNFGTGDFTIEGWVYCTAGGGCPFLNMQDPSNHLIAPYFDTTTSCRVLVGGANALTGITVPASTWYHLAIVRSGTTLTAYVDGTSVASTTYSTAVGSSTSAVTVLGSSVHGTWQGSVDDFRVTRAARYTSNFTPPAAAMDDP